MFIGDLHHFVRLQRCPHQLINLFIEIPLMDPYHIEIRFCHRMLCHEDRAAILVGLDRSLVCIDLLRDLHDLLLVKTDERPVDRHGTHIVRSHEGLHRLRGNLPDALPCDQSQTAALLCDLLRYAHHIPPHDDRQLIVRALIVNVQLDIRKIDDVQIDRPAVSGYGLCQVEHFLCGAPARVRRRTKIHCIELDAALCDHIACHRGIDAARQEQHSFPVRPDGKPSRSRDDRRVDIDLFPHLDAQHHVRLVHVDPQSRKRI